MMLISYFIVHQTKGTTSCSSSQYTCISNYFTCVACVVCIVYCCICCRSMEKATTTWVDSSMMEASLRPAILDVAKSSGCGNPIDADPPADAHAEEPHY
jgi:hypothetical protein